MRSKMFLHRHQCYELVNSFMNWYSLVTFTVEVIIGN